MATAALLAATTLACQAHAGTFLFNFGGSGISGSIDLTYATNPNTGVIPGTLSPNTVDPVGSYIVTGATGTFSDSNIGITNAAITGIVASSPALPDPTNYYAPASFGFYPITNDGKGFSYDGLFYPGGSPQASSDYPFHGGVFDIYGIVFTIAGGDAVNLWSNGYAPFGFSYGVGVTNGTDVLDYQSVPEPATWALMILGLAGVGGAMRASRRRAVAV